MKSVKGMSLTEELYLKRKPTEEVEPESVKCFEGCFILNIICLIFFRGIGYPRRRYN